MTAFSARLAGKVPPTSNIKDGPPSDRPQTPSAQRGGDAKWIAAGFTRPWVRGAPRLAYTWAGEFPQFILTPGFATDDQGTRAGLVARCELADKEILFDYGTPPAIIADQLDDEIIQIMRHDAEEVPLDWRPESGEIDFDDFMEESGMWVRS